MVEKARSIRGGGLSQAADGGWQWQDQVQRRIVKVKIHHDSVTCKLLLEVSNNRNQYTLFTIGLLCSATTYCIRSNLICRCLSAP